MKYDESTIRAFATLRVSGDDLIPSEVTDILCIKPTLAYAKGERYNPGKRSGEMVGRTGVWYFNTDTVVQSYKLINHILFIFSVIAPDSTLVGTVLPTTTPNSIALGRYLFRLARLKSLMEKKNLKSSLTLFWHGPKGAKPPSVPRVISNLLKAIPIEVEADFDTEEDPSLARTG